MFQRGRDVLDFELNEFQDILRVFLLRQMYNGVQNDGTTGVPLNPGANDMGWQCIGTGASNQVTINAGHIFCDGIPIPNASAFAFTGFSTPVSDHTDTVYLAITEVEVADPAQVPQLGETTKRRQLQVTVHISTTGHAGVPSNTSNEIWQGGVHYFMIADIARHAGVATIAPSDVTDLRYLLPPSIISQITRQSNFKVQAIVGDTFETGNGTNHPKSAKQYFDADSDSTFYGFARGWSWTLSRDDIVHARVLANLLEIPTGIIPGWTGGLFIDANALYGSYGTMGFWDLNMSNAPTPPISLTEATGGAVSLRKMEQLFNYTNPTSGDSLSTSLVRAVNARWHVTVGDGTNTFGDFNGVTAIVDAYNLAAHFNVQELSIEVKRGTYNVTAAVTAPITNSTSALSALTIKGCDSSTCFVNLGGTNGTAIKWTGLFTGPNSSTVRIEDVTFLSTATSGSPMNALNILVANVQIRRCRFLKCGVIFQDAQSVVMEDCRIDLHLTSLTQPNVSILVNGSANPQYYPTLEENVATLGPHDFIRCKFDAVTLNNPAINVSATGSSVALSLIQQISFKECSFFLGSAGSTSGHLTGNCGVLEFNPNGSNVGASHGIIIGSVQWLDCQVRANSFGDPGRGGSYGTNSILLHLKLNEGNGKAASGEVGYVTEVVIKGGLWTCPSANTTFNPFTIIGLGIGTCNRVVIHDVQMGFDAQVIQGGPTSDSAHYFDSAHAPPTSQWAAFVVSTPAIDVDVRNWSLTGLGDLSNSGDLLLNYAANLNIDGINLSNAGPGGGGSVPNQRIRLASGGAATSNPGYIRRISTGGTVNGLGGATSATVIIDTGVLASPGEFVFDECIFSTQGVGMQFSPDGQTVLQGVEFRDCVFQTTTSNYGFYVNPGSTAGSITDLIFKGCSFVSNNYGIYISVVHTNTTFYIYGLVITDCVFSSNNSDGIYMESPTLGSTPPFQPPRSTIGIFHNRFRDNNMAAEVGGINRQVSLLNTNYTGTIINPSITFLGNDLLNITDASIPTGSVRVTKDFSSGPGSGTAYASGNAFGPLGSPVGLDTSHYHLVDVTTGSITQQSSQGFLVYTSGLWMNKNIGILQTP